MAVKTYMDLIEEMKALADKINKHYDKVSTLETEIPIEDEKTRILREAGIIEDDNETSEDESTVAEETEAQSDEEETIEEVESAEEYEKDRIREQLDIVGVENDEHINVVGTGRRGEIKARYDDLVRIFGEPTKSKERGDQMDKTNAEWMLEFEVRDEDDPEDTDLIVATIYDWKYPELPLDEVQWNIGGKTWKSYEAVTDYIDNHGATTESDEGPELQRLMKLAGLSVEEAMISGDWEKLGITNDDLEPDDAFGGGAWSVGLGGPNSKFYWFKEQDTGTHFATVVDIGNGTWKIEDADGNVVTDTALKSWDEVESIVGKMFLGPRTAHDETPSAEEYR